MKKALIFIIILILALVPTQVVAAPSMLIPTFSITAVDQDTSVTIVTNNFPAGDTFNVTMGTYGSLGIGGVLVDTQASGSGGSFTASYAIPGSLHSSNRIAIRLESPTSGYYSYNWFWNNDHPSGAPPSPPSPPTPSGWGWPPAGSNTIPSTTIKNVVTDTSVKVKGSNFTTNDSYKVYIGAIGTKGVGGTLVGTQATNGSGTFTETYPIPAAYHGDEKLSIRWESASSGFYAYDWFVNDASAPPSPPASPPSGTGTIPTFTITAVSEDNSVTIHGINFTKNDTYSVYMGNYGTLGIGGVSAGSMATGASSTVNDTFNIPASLHGKNRIAIRLESDSTAYYSYNWFWNNDHP